MLSVIGLREMIFTLSAQPQKRHRRRHRLFIAFIGLQNAGLM